jgi:hypothetical protein
MRGWNKEGRTKRREKGKKVAKWKGEEKKGGEIMKGKERRNNDEEGRMRTKAEVEEGWRKMVVEWRTRGKIFKCWRRERKHEENGGEYCIKKE